MWPFRNDGFARDFLQTTISNDFETFGSDFEVALPPKTPSNIEFETFLVRFRNGAPAQDFLKKRDRHLFCSNSKGGSRLRLPPKQNSKPFGFVDFEMVLPPKTSSKLKFETVRGRFRNSAPAQDLFQNRIRPFRVPISKCPT